MSVVSALLRRFGYVKLRDYGLAIGPGGQILGLDTGAGMTDFTPPLPAAIAGVPRSTMERLPPPRTIPEPAADASGPPTVEASRPAPPSPSPSPSAPPSPSPSPEAAAVEDEWEWTMALARARAAAEQADASPSSPTVTATEPQVTTIGPPPSPPPQAAPDTVRRRKHLAAGTTPPPLPATPRRPRVQAPTDSHAARVLAASRAAAAHHAPRQSAATLPRITSRGIG